MKKFMFKLKVIVLSLITRVERDDEFTTLSCLGNKLRIRETQFSFSVHRSGGDRYVWKEIALRKLRRTPSLVNYWWWSI